MDDGAEHGAGAVLTEGVAVPPAGFAPTAGGLLAGLVRVLTNLFGGLVGVLFGEPPVSGAGRRGGDRWTADRRRDAKARWTN